MGVTPMCKYTPSPLYHFIVSPHVTQFTHQNYPPVAVSFWGYDVGKKLVRALSPPTSAAAGGGELTTAQISAAGFFSAIPMTLITAPFERVKVLLQIQGQSPAGTPPKYKGAFDVVRQLYLTGGIPSVFRGSLATLARDGPGSAAYFATYEIMKKKLTPQDKELSLTAIMMAGGCAGVSMWLLIFPVDTVKSMLQSSDGKLGLPGVVKQVYARGGVKGFFPGLGPALARSFPANAGEFSCCDFSTNDWKLTCRSSNLLGSRIGPQDNGSTSIEPTESTPEAAHSTFT